ncbi:MAG: hypothetical protein DRP45_00280 [Candidatus Zixiibacteriota bacterium]|nr:MAG: hypothetical protein DRP45_00280 [candidate division Zixibacteria bacterium]
MLIWCGVLFALAIFAFVDSVLNMGEVFRQVNSVLFMLISLALFVRTSTKSKEQKLEKYQDKIFVLEREIRSLKEGREKLADY